MGPGAPAKGPFGLTGRSGGGAYSWWIAALDERIKVAVPTAGITTLKNYVLDGAIEGHCDCMFMVNEERWDFDRVAAWGSAPATQRLATRIWRAASLAFRRPKSSSTCSTSDIRPTGL